MPQFLHQILFQNSPSIYLKLTEVVTLLGSLQTGYSEARGLNLKYSKFAQATDQNVKKISSRNGMLICYGPSLAISSLFLLYKLEGVKVIPPLIPQSTGLLSVLSTVGLDQNAGDLRMIALASALTIHFLKRELEVLFVHRYSGHMTLQTALLISCSYLFTSANLLYAQLVYESIWPPVMDLTWLGIGLFVVGIAGNYYHHYLLSRIRKKGQDVYAVPQGGLFPLVVCPHYLFEIIGWAGMAFISQTPYAFCSLLGTLFYLMGRSYATRQWYLQKMDDFPRQRKAIFPFIF